MSAPGKWGDPSVPKHGWTCTDIEDLEDERAVCEMCEVQEIRYVHTMAHAEHAELRCGCVCAGRMEGDEHAAAVREERFKNLAARRAAFPSRKAWRRSESGNPFIRVNGFLITVFPKPGGFGAFLHDRTTDRREFARRTYASPEAAARAAFDAMIWAQRNWRGRAA
jgi:hypothetical protein